MSNRTDAAIAKAIKRPGLTASAASKESTLHSLFKEEACAHSSNVFSAHAAAKLQQLRTPHPGHRDRGPDRLRAISSRYQKC
jgi:hypothetical protein